MLDEDKDDDPGTDWDETTSIETESVWKRATGEFDKKLEEPPPSPPQKSDEDNDS